MLLVNAHMSRACVRRVPGHRGLFQDGANAHNPAVNVRHCCRGRARLVLVRLAAVVAMGAVAAAQGTSSRALTIAPLPTAFGVSDEPAPAYARTITVDAPPQLQIAAYGVANQVWLAPRSWTGGGTVGVDGNVSVELHPVTGDSSVSYHLVPACMVCQLGRAAPFFPNAVTEWNRRYNSNGSMPLTAPSLGLAVSRADSRLARYSLPDRNGLHVRGVAFYAPDEDGLFAQAEVALPREDDTLSDFLLTYFVAHIPHCC